MSARHPEATALLARELARPASYRHPCGRITRLETHLSWVFLTGPFAYKVKKPVDLGFVNFTTPARRRRFCHEELRLNRRLAPDLYLDVVGIAGTPERPRVGGSGPAFDYAVRMRQFPGRALASTALAAGRVRTTHMDRLAQDVAAFHERIPRSKVRGTPAALRAAVRHNFAALREVPDLRASRRKLKRLEHWSEARFKALAPVLRRRRRAGHVRECHGDLHLGNMVLLDGRLVMFDCIEFNPALRWIDTAGEVAFVVMDLMHRDAPAFAHRFLNAYLEAGGDYGLLEVLDYFLVYRAMVRAKVAGLRALQCASRSPARRSAVAEARSYLDLALSLARNGRPALFITHGVSGTGKTTLAQTLVDELGIIRVRSDVERKRLFSLDRLARSGSALRAGIYSAQATRQTYSRLARLATAIVNAGFTALVDATFLERRDRRRFARLAARLGVPFHLLSLQAPAAVLRRRIAARSSDASEVSEATAAVLEAQLRRYRPPGAEEQGQLTVVDTTAPDVARQLMSAAREVQR